MFPETGIDEIYSFANADGLPEQPYEPEETKEQLAISAESAAEAMQILDSMGILEKGGFFLSDIDNTLRTTSKGLGKGAPGKIPDESLDMLAQLREKGWFVGTISNRSKQIVALETAIARKAGYKSFEELGALADFQIYGGENPFDLKTKSKPETVEAVITEIEKMNNLVNGELKAKPIIWMGDSAGDEEFGKKLLLELRERGYNNGILIKLPDRLGNSFEKNIETTINYNEKHSKPPAAIIESQIDGEMVPITEFLKNMRQRIIYAAENAPVSDETKMDAIEDIVHGAIFKRRIKLAEKDFNRYKHNNSDKVNQVLNTEVVWTMDPSKTLEDNGVAVRNPHEYRLLIKECNKLAKLSELAKPNPDEHEIHHWLGLLESNSKLDATKMIFGIRFRKDEKGVLEYYPLVIPTEKITIGAFLQMQYGPNRINDLSTGDMEIISNLLTSIVDSDGNAREAINDYVSKF